MHSNHSSIKPPLGFPSVSSIIIFITELRAGTLLRCYGDCTEENHSWRSAAFDNSPLQPDVAFVPSTWPWRCWGKQSRGCREYPRSTALPLALDTNSSLSFGPVEEPANLVLNSSPTSDPLPCSCVSLTKSFLDLCFLTWKWGGRVCGWCRR